MNMAPDHYFNVFFFAPCHFALFDVWLIKCSRVRCEIHLLKWHNVHLYVVKYTWRFLQLLLYVTIAFSHKQMSSGDFQPSLSVSTLTTTLSSWWMNSGDQVTAHLLMASRFLPLSCSVSSMKLAQPPLPSYTQHSCPCLKPTSAAVYWFGRKASTTYLHQKQPCLPSFIFTLLN